MAVDVAALQREHPEWNIVDAVENKGPGGGVWAVGADGGVFALGGAPFMGSYAGESAAVRNDPTRRFTHIQFDPATGGYKLLTDRPWESYNYRPAASTPATGGPGGEKPGAAEPGAAPPGQEPERIRLQGLLGDLGLGELADKAYTYWKSLGGTASADDIDIWLQGQPEYEARFPGMKALRDKGLTWTPAQYIGYERAVDFAIKGSGLPAGFFDSRDDFGQFISNGWSPDEITDAIGKAADAVANMPPEVRAALSRWEDANGVMLTDGELASLWLSPDVAVPLIDARVKKAVLGGYATTTGFAAAFGGELTEEEAGRTGLSAEGLASVTRLNPLFAETAEEGTDIGRETALGAAAGVVSEEERLRRRKEARTARFAGGGGAAGIGGQQSGLGTAQ